MDHYRFFVYLFLIACCPIHAAPEVWEAQGPNVRVMRHQDGSRTLYRRTPGKKTLVKKNIGMDGNIRYVTNYYMDDHGNPRSCKIYDSRKNVLFKVSYAYQISTGRLIAERMFDAQRKDPQSGKPFLVREMRYMYDAQGNRSKPIAFTFVKGQTAEEVFGKRDTTFPEQVFDDQKKTANPNAKRLGN